MAGPYDDIISLPHHQSSVHPHMPNSSRAAQFAPFAALTGYGDAVEETARLTEDRIELTEDAQNLLWLKLQFLESVTAQHPPISVTYFQPDLHKAGGAYVTVQGTLKSIDSITRSLTLQDRTAVSFGDIVAIESPVLPEALGESVPV